MQKFNFLTSTKQLAFTAVVQFKRHRVFKLLSIKILNTNRLENIDTGLTLYNYCDPRRMKKKMMELD